MKNFLIFLLELLIMYILFPVIFVGCMAWLWVPMFFEFRGAVVVGIVITILTLAVIIFVDYKFESVN